MNNEFDKNIDLESEVNVPEENIVEDLDHADLEREVLDNQIRSQTSQLRKQKNNMNQNAANRLKLRKLNTLSEKVESKNSTSSNNVEKNPQDGEYDNDEQSVKRINPLDKFKLKGQNMGKSAGDATKQAIKKVGKAALTGIKALALNPATAPFFWGGIMIIILLILVPILWGAYEDSSNSEEGSEQFGTVCSYNVNGVNYENLKVRLLKCGSHTPIPGEELISFDKYVLGVAYAENEGAPAEGIKAEAVAAKSYALRRPDKMVGAFDLKFTKEDGYTVLNIRNCTSDQVYCDPDKGCSTETGSTGDTVYSGANTKAYRYKPALAENSEIRQAVAEISDKVLVDSGNNNIFYATYTDVQQKRWNAGAREGKTYKQMLEETYSGTKVASIVCETTEKEVVVGNCTVSTPIPLNGQDYYVTSKYGPRWGSFHRGVDLGASTGTPIYSVFDGTVIHSGWYGTGGNAVIVAHDLNGDGIADYNTRYYHMSKIIAQNGQKVTGGQLIGEVGSTGASTGPHLHFGLESTTEGYIDPYPTLEAIRSGTSMFNTATTCRKNSQFPYYEQCNNKWRTKKICDKADTENGPCTATQTICSSGCGYTSFAMIASGLNNDKNITPATVVDFVSQYSYNKTGGAISDDALKNSEVMNKYKLKYEELFPRDSLMSLEQKKSKIVSALKSGKAVELLVPNHFVALVSMKGDKIQLNDPSRKDNTGLHTIDEIFEIYRYQRKNQMKGKYVDSDFFVMAIAYSRG